MFKFNELKQIDLEITNNCQASCPMCLRNVNGGLINPLIKLNEWSLIDFKQIMTVEVLNQITDYYFCGNYGDPLLNNNLISMCEYSKTVAPNTSIGIHTNGSLRNSEYWTKLAHSLPINHRVVFALDGLSDTHSLYRIGTDFNQIIDNAKAFISAGGNAYWVFIRFEHNQHQVETARQMASDLGFSKFTVKDSTRYIGEPEFKVVDKEGNYTYSLKPSTETVINFVDSKKLNNFKEFVQTSTISCKVLKTKSIYIDAFKNVYSCAFQAAIPYIFKDFTIVSDIANQMKIQHDEMVNKMRNINALNSSIKDIINSDTYQSMWQEYWTTNKSIMCSKSCGEII
jgi:MoaA/NifB/PqqE/SkfB family radical SAM enzyme